MTRKTNNNEEIYKQLLHCFVDVNERGLLNYFVCLIELIIFHSLYFLRQLIYLFMYILIHRTVSNRNVTLHENGKLRS